MKIEWLDENHLRARVTKGWFRKRWTTVYKDSANDVWWKFEATKEPARSLDRRMDRARAEALRVEPWQPLAALPQARQVRR